MRSNLQLEVGNVALQIFLSDNEEMNEIETESLRKAFRGNIDIFV